MSLTIKPSHALIAMAMMAAPVAAWADPIPGLYNTGLASDGNKHPGSGGRDEHYRVNGGPAVTYYNGAYPVRADAQWTAQSGDGSYPIGNETVEYTLTFDLTGYNIATARISGTFAIDNEGTVRLNDGPVLAKNLSFVEMTPFTATSGFKPGINTLTFTVTDLGPPSAFLVTGLSGTADRSTPPMWITGDYGPWSSVCGEATRTRAVTCVSPDDQTVLDPSSCVGAKPASSESSYRTSGCGYDWIPSQWSASTPACGASSQTRTITCKRADGPIVENGMCDATRMPATTQATSDYSACGYEWAVGTYGAPSTTCGTATQTRSVTCTRTDGAAMPDESCTKTKPETSTTTSQTSGCGHEWRTGEYAEPAAACGPSVKYRAVWCFRSDGQKMDDEACAGVGTKPVTQEAAPSYETCSYQWAVAEWGAPTTTCGDATEARAVTCHRSDGGTVGDALCKTGDKPDTSRESHQTTGCAHEWRTGEFGAPVAACGATTQSRTVSCLRADGQTVADASCTAFKPSTVQAAVDYSTCSFKWTTDEWSTPSACGDVVRTRTVTCRRSNGDAVSETSCDAGTRPSASETVAETSTCSYAWRQSTVGAWSDCADGSQTRSIAVDCRRSDGSKVEDALCTTARPDVSESRSCGTTAPTPTPEDKDGVIVFRRALGVGTRNR